MKIVVDVDKYEQLKLAASKLAESEKIIKEHLIHETITLHYHELILRKTAIMRSQL